LNPYGGTSGEEAALSTLLDGFDSRYLQILRRILGGGQGVAETERRPLPNTNG